MISVASAAAVASAELRRVTKYRYSPYFNESDITVPTACSSSFAFSVPGIVLSCWITVSDL